MIIFNKLETYNFQNKNNSKNKVHVPRIYLNDFLKVNKCLKALKKKKYLNNSELPAATSSTRNEEPREIFLLLWRLNIGVEVVRDRTTYAFKYNDKLDEYIDNEKKYIHFILKNFYKYLPISSVLNYINILNKKNEKISEKILEDKFHKVYSRGNADNIHPLVRMIKGFELINEKFELSDIGKNFLKLCNDHNPFYIHQKVDEIHDKFEVFVIELIHQLSSIDKQKFLIKEIMDMPFISEFHRKEIYKMGKEEFADQIGDLQSKYPFKIKNDQLILENKIFFDIKAIDFINSSLNKKFREKKSQSNKDSKKIKLTVNDPLIICENDDNTNLPFEKITYNDFKNNADEIINASPKFIILNKGWSPIENVKISGYLNAYIRFGGNLVVIDSSIGRMGANHNQFQWLPEELSRLQYLKKGCFKFTFGENLFETKKIDYHSLMQGKNEYACLVLSYYQGTITFVTSAYLANLDFSESYYSENISITSSSKEWKNSTIIHLAANTVGERNMYEPIRKFMSSNFRFKFPDNWSDHATTDIFSISPFKCLFEVDTLGHNQLIATDFKVTEVDKHFKHMISGKKKIKDIDLTQDIGKCVIAYDFSKSDGDEKYGAIETAKLYKVNLLRYRDLFDMSCLKLSESDFKYLIYEYDEIEDEPEVSKKLYKFKNIK